MATDTNTGVVRGSVVLAGGTSPASPTANVNDELFTSYATADLGDLLDNTTLTMKSLGLSLPLRTSDILGVEVKVRHARGTSGDVNIINVQLLSTSGAPVGNNKAVPPVAVPLTTPIDSTFGGASDLWGLALTKAWVEDPDFGVTVTLETPSAGSTDTRVYDIHLIIYYRVRGKKKRRAWKFEPRR